MQRAGTVDDYIADATKWRDELKRLRDILSTMDLKEEVKWGGPCYSYNGKNVVGMAGFKSYFGLWFFQGALLKDDKKVLMNAQEGKTKAMRHWRMQSGEEIEPAIVKRYVREAIKLVKSGKQVAPARRKAVVVPAELRKAFRTDRQVAVSFKKLRFGLQWEYADYIAEAKREDTKLRRIEKILPMIRAGGGLNDKYRR